MNQKIVKTLGFSWLEIDLDAIKHNTQSIKELIGKQVRIMGIVKGNGYGHDAIEVSRIILENGVDQLGVARIEEAIILRKNNIKAPILVLGAVLEEQIKLYLDYQIMATIGDIDSANKINKIAKKFNQKIKAHLKIDTGMGRLGIKPFEAKAFFSKLKKLHNIEIVGLFTHFSTADESNKDYTFYQFQLFKEVEDLFSSLNKPSAFCSHAANSGAILDLPETWLDMVRPGCILYGLYPSVDIDKKINLIPALTFKTRVFFIKKIKAGSFIGYGNTYQAKKDIIVATLPVGYADGYSRLLSNSGQVLIRGKLALIIGRVCMDQLMVDITNINQVKIGDEVILWGAQAPKKLKIAIEDIGEKLNTIGEEVLHYTDKARVAKLFIKEGRPWKVKNMFGEYYCEI